MRRPAMTKRWSETQHTAAAFLRGRGWPYAEAVGNGRPGADVTGTPGLSVEVKALDDDLLDLGQRGGGLPGDAQRAEPGRGQVAQRGTEGRVGREPAEVARVLDLGHARDHDGFQVGQEAGEGFGLLRGSG